MAERTPQREDWRVPQGAPAIAAVGLLTTIAAVLLLAGHVYDTHIAPKHRAPVATFPAPGVETYVHDGALDPERPRPRATVDPALAAAERAVVAEGWR